MTIGSSAITKLTVTPASPQIFTGASQQFTATATYSDGSTKDLSATVVWSATPAAVATINTAGLMKAVAAGTFTVTATSGSLVATSNGLIIDPTLNSIAITPAPVNLASRGTQQFTATGNYIDQSKKDLTSSVTWTSSNTTALTITTAGLATAGSVTTATAVTVTAQLGSIFAAAAVNVTPQAAVTSLVVKPTSGSIAQGSAQQNTATAIYSDGTQQDVTNQVTWSVTVSPLNRVKKHSVAPRDTSTGEVTVDQNGVAFANLVGAANVQASLGPVVGQSVLLVRNTTVRSIAINTPDAQVPVGATQQLTLSGVFSDGSSQDLSLTANWQSSNTSIATIDSKGVMTAVTAGDVKFLASFGGLATSTGNVEVLATDLVSLTVKVPNPVNNTGGVQQLSVLGLYSNGNPQNLTPLATWRSSNSSALQVSNTGFAQCVGPGKVQVTSTVAGFSTVTSIECIATQITSFDILPTTASFALGTNLQFTALGHAVGGGFFDGTKLVTWTSSDPTVLTIDQNGLAKSGKVGSTTVTGVEEGVSGVSGVVTVTNAALASIALTPLSARIAAGTHAQFDVWGWFSDGSVQDISDTVLWTVSDTTVGSADLDGTIYGIAPGTVTITANAGTISAAAPLTVTNATLLSTVVTPGNIEMPQGVEQQLSLIGNFSDGTTQDLSADAIWLSPTPNIAFTTQTGAAVGFNLGIGTIGAQLGNFTSSTQVNVTNASLTAIALAPASTVIRLQGSQQMNATGTFSDGFEQSLYLNAVFSVANPGVATILGAKGLVAGTGLGATQITASFRGLQASSNFTVESGTLVSIALTPPNPAVTAGGTSQFTATGTYADGTTQDLSKQVTWTSSNPAVLSVDSNGLATAHALTAAVTVTVTAQYGTTTQSFTVTISPAGSGNGSITALAVNPSNALIASGSTRQFSATATYSNGNTGDVSGTTAWTSSNPSIATINGSGLASAVGTGSTIISATSNGVSANATLTVASAPAPVATLISIAVSPTSAAINMGSTVLFTASGTYSDGTIEDVSSSVTWQSSNTAVATVNSTGWATGVSAGAATITAQLNGMTGAASLTVNPVTPPGVTVTAITIAPVTANIAVHRSQQFAATATYSNNTTQNVTTAVTWASSSPAVATINQAGFASGVATGSTAISAALGGTSGTASLVVGSGGPGNPPLTDISITPASTSIVVGATQQYTATGTYSDGTTQNITSSVAWSSSISATASVTSAGLATGAAAGTTTITAQSGSLTGTSALTVTASSATLISLVITPTSSQIISGLSQQFAVVGTYSDGTTRNIASTSSWSSSNQAVALVNTTGQVTGVTSGIATVTCTSGSMQGSTTVIVNTATLQSVAISPSGASFAAGATQQLKLTGAYSNGSQVDLTSAATWSSLTPSAATVSSTGLVTGVAAGTVRITALFQTQTGSTTVQITPATLVSVAISPSSLVFARGTNQQLMVTGTYSDGTTHDVTGQATYLSSNATVLTVSSAGLAFGASPGTVRITVTVAGVTATTQTLAVTPANLVSIAITPLNPTFAKGTTQKFTAIGTFSDGSTQDLSSEAVWSSSNPQTATIDGNGLASSGSPGSTQISATFQGVTGTSGTAQVSSAVLSGLVVSPSVSQIAKGTSQQFTASGAYSDGTMQSLTSNVNWSSSGPTVASISANGLASGNNVGSAQITASFQSSTASTSSFQVTPATLTSIAFSPTSPSVATGTSAQVTVIGTFSDGSTQNLTSSSNFSSSNPSVVTVNSSGLITGVGPGTSTVTVSVDGVTSTFTATDAPVTLTSIAVTPANPPSFAKGTSQQFAAIGTFSDGSTQDLSSTVTWTTADPTVFTVDSHGLATGTGTGTATLTAAYQGHTATAPVQVTPAVVASIIVTPANASLVMASTQQYAATATYTDATTVNVTSSATWSSSSPTVATISSTSGLATALLSGSTTIAASYNSISGSTGLTVTSIIAPTLASVSVAPSTATVALGNTQQFTATANYSDSSTASVTGQATWQSSAPAIATVNNQGLASSVSGGNAQISAAYQGMTGVAALTVSSATLVSLSVTPATATLASGTAQQYHATGTLSDGSTQDLTSSVTWTSSNTAVATINTSGLASTLSVGSTTITATAGVVTGTASLTVTSATVVTLQATPPATTLPAGGTQQLMVTAVFTDGTSQNVTNNVVYASANTGVATVNVTGNVMATGIGSSSVTATLGTTTATVQVVVTSATLTSLAVTPANFSLAIGLSQQMKATGTFSDGSTEDQTSSVVWASSAPTVATVSTAGKVQVSQAGSAIITATTGTASGTANLTATSATVSAIAISPATVTLAVGQTQQFTGTATLSDGTQQNVTSSANWGTSDITKGTVSNVAGFNGVLTTISAGNFTVTATLNTITGSTPVTVTNAVLTSLTVSPSPASLPAGTAQQLTVTGNYSDGSTADVTNTATWTSSAAAIASVDAGGLLHGLSTGSATVTATVGLTTKGDAVVVNNAVLNTISINPSNSSIPLGVQSQLTAVGNYSDGSTANLTSQVQWGSTSPAVATVSVGGLVSTLSAGSTQISATLGSVSKQSPLTVTSAVLSSITVQSSQTSFALGVSLPLTAIAIYSDSSTQNVTTLVTWSSQAPSVGVVSSMGVATGVRTGSFAAQATLNGVSGTLSLTVTSAVLQSIVVTPANARILNVLGTASTQFTATGHFSDGSTQNITNTCHWAITSGLTLGSISQTGSFSASALSLGSGTLSATSGSVAGSTNFTVVSVL